jgi:hypothetical protein
MAELLGVGMTHYPGLRYPDAHMANVLRQLIARPGAGPELRDPARWPEAMRAEWGSDEGLAAARRHRERQVAALRRIRAEIDRFHPDLVLIWGDDQAENFLDDAVPPFCALLYDEVVCRPFVHGSAITRGREGVDAIPNVWNEPLEKAFQVRCHREAGEYLCDGLLAAGFDVAYAYRPLHFEELTHAFTNTLLYLDYDRKGFDVPVLPFHVNCYGRDLFRRRAHVAKGVAERAVPGGPTPARCHALGRATREVLAASPWRAVLIGSSSWSHAFLRRDGCILHPDLEADRRRLEELRAGRHAAWQELSSEELERAGQHEFRNWICLAGAMHDRRAEILDYVETHVFNSNKCFALFPEPGGGRSAEEAS